MAVVHVRSRADEEDAAILQVFQLVGRGRAGVHADDGASVAAGDLAAPQVVPLEAGRHDAQPARVGQERAPVADEPAGGNVKFHADHAGVQADHVDHIGLAVRQLLNDDALKLFRHVND